MTQEKVLIVEDEENERTGLAELVRAWGFDAEVACDGVEGMEKMDTFNPGIVITDLKMPRMDGMELLAHIAGHPQRVAVILLTAQGSVDAAVTAMKSGAFDFIEKPVNPTRLRSILQNASRHARHRARTGSQPPQAARSRRAGLAGGPVQADAGGLPPDRDGGAQHGVGADHRRKRHRQGTGGAHHPLAEPAQNQAIRGHQLRRYSGDVDRERNLRPRERRFYRGDGAPHRLLRTG